LRHAGRIQNPEAVGRIKSAEKVAGEDRFFDCFETVGPAMPDPAQRQEGLKTSEAKFLVRHIAG
jgi:hypothetical protein